MRFEISGGLSLGLRTVAERSSREETIVVRYMRALAYTRRRCIATCRLIS